MLHSYPWLNAVFVGVLERHLHSKVTCDIVAHKLLDIKINYLTYLLRSLGRTLDTGVWV